MYNKRERFARGRRVPYKGAGVAISDMLWHSVMFGNTFKHLHSGGEFFYDCGLDCMVNRAWIRGSCKLCSIKQKTFSLRPRVVVNDVGTAVHVKSRGWLVGVRWARAVREGGVSY